jgi:hypothetical protein
MGGRVIDLTNRRIGNLLVRERAANGADKCARWECKCLVLHAPDGHICGKIFIRRSAVLLKQSGLGGCGRSHGWRKMPEYFVCLGMINRCTNSNNELYHAYGGRGIRVCEFLSVPQNFIIFMGRCPDRYTIERQDNDANYSCGGCNECKSKGWKKNVVWATRAEQARNTSQNAWLTLNGRTMCLMDWSKDPQCVNLGITHTALTHRVLRGWTDKQALTIPIYSRRVSSQKL